MPSLAEANEAAKPRTAPAAASPINVGVFVSRVRPASPSQAKLQERILEGVRRQADGRYQFHLFSLDRTADATAPWPHHPIRSRGPWAEAGVQLGARAARSLTSIWTLAGATGGRTLERLARWSTTEPAHFQQLRDLDIRILWNVNQHELETPTPFIRTIWEANHRIHSMYPEYAYARYGFDGVDGGMAYSLARASYVITGTREGAQQLVQMLGVHPSKIRVIPFPAPQLPTGEAAPASDPYILYPSRFWPHKNHVVILEALGHLREARGRAPRCVFVGADGGNLAYVLAYADRIGVRDLIDYRGEVSDDELARLYRGAWALTYASAVGPDNLPPLEAMSVGCPVITADVPGAREQYGEAALFFDPLDEADLARRLTELASQPGLRDELKRRGLAHVEPLTAEGYGASVIAILDEFATVCRAWERCDSAFV